MSHADEVAAKKAAFLKAAQDLEAAETAPEAAAPEAEKPTASVLDEVDDVQVSQETAAAKQASKTVADHVADSNSALAQAHAAAQAQGAANAEAERARVDEANSAGKEVAPPVGDLDRSRSFGTVSGEYVVGETRVRYQQDGKNFDFYGKLIKE